MKNLFIKILLCVFSICLLGCLLVGCKSANEKKYTDGLIYLEITRNDEVVAYSVSGIQSSGIKNIIIPPTYKNLPVIEVAEKAFYNCNDVYSVILPDSIVEIGTKAFYSCHNLYYIEIGSGLNYIGEQAFFNCHKLVEVYNKSLIDIEYGSEENGAIGYYALNRFTPTKGETKIVRYEEFILFEGEDKGFVLGYEGNEANIVIPSFYNGKELDIYKYAFYGNLNIYSVESLYYQSSISDYAFYGCKNLRNIGFHRNNLETIGDYAFYNCTSLTELNLPYNLRAIGSHAFSNCTSISYIKIEALRCSSEGAAFENVGKDCDVCSVDISGDYIPMALFNNSYITSIEFDKENIFLEIGERAFSNCKRLSNILFPNPKNPPTATTSSIGAYAFAGCSSLSSVKITSTIGFIGRYAFSGCYNLNSVVFDRTSGWVACYDDYNEINISESTLTSSQNAASALKKYMGYDWIENSW